MEPVHIGGHSDDPPHFLLWQLDDVAPIIMGLLIGMMIGKAFICVLIGLLVTRLYQKFRDGHAQGFMKHLLYHYGFSFTKAPSIFNPFIKHFIP